MSNQKNWLTLKDLCGIALCNTFALFKICSSKKLGPVDQCFSNYLYSEIICLVNAAVFSSCGIIFKR